MKQKRPSMRAAINAFCKACIYDPHPGNGTWREQVRDCTAPHCPLYPLRPVPSTREGSKTGAITADLAPAPATPPADCREAENGAETGPK